MRYKLVLTRRAAKDIARLRGGGWRKGKGSLEEYSKEPLSYARKMVDASLGTYRFRIGDYRVIFDLENDQLVVLRVGHRREIYRG